MKLTITKEQLQTVALFAAQKDVRYYLEGIYVKAHNGAALMVAVNGHMMGILRLELGEDDQAPEGEGIIIPNEAIALAIKATKKGHKIEITPTSIGAISYKPIDGHYPDFMRVVPKELDGVLAHFDPEYTMAFKKAAVLIGSNYIQIMHNSTGASLVHIGNENFVGVLMPMRVGEHISTPPAWLVGEPAKEEKEAEAT